MGNIKKTESQAVFYNIIIWGAVWGIFEATAGYFLHQISFSYSWLIWYPVACFFLANVYRKTGRLTAAVCAGLLCAAIKMLNLFLPGRIDKVLNPAISIIFEAITLAAFAYAVNHLLKGKKKSPLIKALMALGMNTGWRLLYVLFLLFLVPDWIREVSVISTMSKFVPFFITQNLLTTAIVFIGYQYATYIFRPMQSIEHRLSTRIGNVSRGASVIQPAVAAVLLCTNIVLQFLLK